HEPRAQRREQEHRDDERDDDLPPHGRTERGRGSTAERAAREHEQEQVEREHLDQQEQASDGHPPQRLGHGTSPLPALNGDRLFCRSFATLYSSGYLVARAAQRSPRRSSSSGRPKALERFSAVSVCSIGPAAWTFPSRRSSR